MQTTTPFEIRRIIRPRPPGSAAHAEVQEILARAVRQLGLAPFGRNGYLLPYHTDGNVRLANIAAVLPGRDPSLPPMILGAHYDTVPETPGADDNAAAIDVVFRALEGLKPGTFRHPVLAVFFDAEEPGYYLGPLMGSTNFYQRELAGQVHCAFIFDLVGHDVPVSGIEDLVFVTGMESHPSFEPVLSETRPEKGMRVVPALNRYVGDVSDHHIFRVREEPYLFFSCGRWEHYHRPSDTAERLNMQKIKALAAYIRRLLEACDRAEFSTSSRWAVRRRWGASASARWRCGRWRRTAQPTRCRRS